MAARVEQRRRAGRAGLDEALRDARQAVINLNTLDHKDAAKGLGPRDPVVVRVGPGVREEPRRLRPAGHPAEAHTTSATRGRRRGSPIGSPRGYCTGVAGWT
ncbi:hypothetical protein HBB16_06920 [Pseudonocardia sp. MCCB 268]|nr:hypothetical protein [Pseudonocardia cytotoxica]